LYQIVTGGQRELRPIVPPPRRAPGPALTSVNKRIRWDPEFGHGKFIIGYYDGIEQQIIKVPLARNEFATDSTSSFDAIEADGSVHSVPYQRVRQVYRDGELIWRRPEPPAAHQR
jgi:uncharacterized protein (UPF0248 family)